jgi:hypothetical protein
MMIGDGIRVNTTHTSQGCAGLVKASPDRVLQSPDCRNHRADDLLTNNQAVFGESKRVIRAPATDFTQVVSKLELWLTSYPSFQLSYRLTTSFCHISTRPATERLNPKLDT